ncbi:MAG TPA: GNAT family N-acetyltransferase [Tepidisphaeraceae bacterium]|jgi:RimJ/RimL family protein N-acetyltransferase|nr:GNAT family N-acetyltransferase [Tepidisphaeraceae bacterium]
MKELLTARLRIRRFAREDLASVARLLDGCFGPATLDVRREWLEWAVRNYSALEQLGQPPYGDYAISLLDGGTVIGSIGLVPSFGPFGKLPSLQSSSTRNANLFRPEMGLFWAIDPKHHGQGYATEAAKTMADFAFGQLHVERLVATTEHDNFASIGVMKRLGMTIERNPDPEPQWFQTIGVLFNPKSSRSS